MIKEKLNIEGRRQENLNKKRGRRQEFNKYKRYKLKAVEV